MKKKINGKKNKITKKITIFIVITIFLLAITPTLILMNRKYLFIESFFKEANARANRYFINHMYSNKDFKNSMINSKTKYLEYENEILRKSLKFKESNSNYKLCEIVNHTSKYFYDRIDINLGSKKGVKKSDPVITDKGLIGFVSKVGENVSEVKLLTSINENNMLSVAIEKDEQKIYGVLRGYDPIKNVFEVTDIVGKTDNLKDASVFLSNYNNNSYGGILIGKVDEEKSNEYGLSKKVLVKQDVDYNNLLFVAVVMGKWYI